jgi:hypothetical protein
MVSHAVDLGVVATLPGVDPAGLRLSKPTGGALCFFAPRSDCQGSSGG